MDNVGELGRLVFRAAQTLRDYTVESEDAVLLGVIEDLSVALRVRRTMRRDRVSALLATVKRLPPTPLL